MEIESKLVNVIHLTTRIQSSRTIRIEFPTCYIDAVLKIPLITSTKISSFNFQMFNYKI